MFRKLSKFESWMSGPAVLAAGLLFIFSPAYAEDWPREMKAGEATVVMYQPQVESFEGDSLSARAAVMVRKSDDAEPVFGAVWMDSRVSTDRETRMVDLLEVKVTNVKFPNASKEQSQQLAELIEREAPKWNISISLDGLLAELDLVKKEKAASEDLNNAPPRILYANVPAVLVVIDGDPIFRDVEGTDYKYVANTPFLMVQDPASKRLYLKGGETWFTAADIEGEWSATANPPREAIEIAKKHVEQTEKNSPATQAAPEEAAGTGEPVETVVPKIIVSTEPAELVQTNGDPNLAPIADSKLLYVKNSEDDILFDIDTQQYYVLLSGRWYASKSLSGGPWKFIAPDRLPDDFAIIPAESDMGNVRASVAGTEESRDAVLENEIPQTAAVDRKEAKVQVTYDGEPKFERIEGTAMSYAVNTDKSVILIGGRYYCCDNAVWFAAADPRGPWDVCVEVPKDVQTIPPSAPVYNVKYVYVYDYTPEVVYVGYTPGYYGSYVYGGCVFYGTGYYYHPWYGNYYYPRPVTYGFGIHYSPYGGWGFSFGVSYGWFHVGFSTYSAGWWGPAGYHYGYRHGYAHGYHHGYHAGARAGYRAGYYAGQHSPSPNLYSQRDGVRTTGGRNKAAPSTNDRRAPGAAAKGPQDRSKAGAGPGQAQKIQRAETADAAARPNNVYTDKNGNVYRKGDKGWEQRSADGWSKMDPQKSTRDKSQIQKNQQQLSKQSEARERGNAKAQSYQKGTTPQRTKSAPARQPSRGGGRRR